MNGLDWDKGFPKIAAVSQKMLSKFLSQRLVLYGVGAGAASLASSAEATIHYSGPVEFSGNSIYFDLQNTVPPSTSLMVGSDDFHLQSKTTSMSGGKAGISTYGGAAVMYQTRFTPMTMSPKAYSLKLNAGTTIGASGSFTQFYSYLQDTYTGPFHSGFNQGDWSPGDRGFLGLRLTVGADTFFGWADVSLNTLTSPGTVFTLHGYAYEDVAGMSIAAGAGAIPEPSTIALLVAGAAGILALKRRKK